MGGGRWGKVKTQWKQHNNNHEKNSFVDLNEKKNKEHTYKER